MKHDEDELKRITAYLSTCLRPKGMTVMDSVVRLALVKYAEHRNKALTTQIAELKKALAERHRVACQYENLAKLERDNSKGKGGFSNSEPTFIERLKAFAASSEPHPLLAKEFVIESYEELSDAVDKTAQESMKDDYLKGSVDWHKKLGAEDAARGADPIWPKGTQSIKEPFKRHPPLYEAGDLLEYRPPAAVPFDVIVLGLDHYSPFNKSAVYLVQVWDDTQTLMKHKVEEHVLHRHEAKS